MVRVCIVDTCRVEYYPDCGLSFHRFPTNRDLRTKWVRAIPRVKKICKYSVICSKHFRSEDYVAHLSRPVIKETAVPSVFDLVNKTSTSLREKYDKSKGKQANVSSADKNYISCHLEQNKSEVLNMFIEKDNEEKLPITSNEFDDKMENDYMHFNGTGNRLQEDTMSETIPDLSTVKEEKDEECRACLQKIDSEYTFYNMFDCWPQQMGDTDNLIAEDLAKLANVQLLQTDEHSKVICAACCTLLQSACNFVATVRRNDEILRQRYKNPDTSNDRVWPKPIQLNKNVDSAMYDNGVNVEIKQEAHSEDEYNGYDDTDTREENVDNMDIKVEPEEITQHLPSPVTVNGILYDQTNDRSIDGSVLTNGNDNSSEEAEQPVKNEPISEEDESEIVLPEMSLECMLCMKSFNSVTGLKAHVIAQHSYKSVKRKVNNSISPEKKKRKYTCTTCRRNFTTSTDLMVHETCHNKSICYRCCKNFDNFAQLTEHRTKCTASASTEVAKLRTLEDAKRPPSQEPQTEFMCSVCDISFSEAYYMKVHQDVHHNMSEEQNETELNPMEVETLENVFE